MLFAADMARGFFGHLVSAVRGSSQYRKSSFLLDAAGEQVLPAFVQMQERPHLPRALASSPFDAEGVATRDRELVRDGVLQGYVLGSYSARKLGLHTTGNAGGIHNLLVTSTAGLLICRQLLRSMGTGLYVTELMGQGVNGVTGDYSRGATGFWVEGGDHRLSGARSDRRRQPAGRCIAACRRWARMSTCSARSAPARVLVDEVTIAGS